MTSYHQKATVRCKPDTLDRVCAIQVEQLEAFQLEILTFVVINLEYLKDTFFIAYDEVLSIWGKVTALGRMCQLDGIDEAVFHVGSLWDKELVIGEQAEELVLAH